MNFEETFTTSEVKLKVNYNIIPRVYVVKEGKHIEVNVPQAIFEKANEWARERILDDILDEITIEKDHRGFYIIK